MSMTNAQMRTFVRALSGDRQQVLFSDSDLTTYLNMAIREIAGRLECCTSAATYDENDFSTYPGGTGAISLGSVHVIRVIRVINAEGIALREVAKDVYERPGLKVTPTATRELPHSYWYMPVEASISAATSAAYRALKLYPYQDTTNPNFSLTVHFSFYPEDLVADDDVCQLPPTLAEAACYRALALCKIQEENYKAAQFIMQDFDARIAQAMYELGPAGFDHYGEVRGNEEVPADYITGL